MSNKPLRSLVVSSPAASIAVSVLWLAASACTGNSAGSETRTTQTSGGGAPDRAGVGGDRGDGGSDGDGGAPGVTSGGDGGAGGTSTATASASTSASSASSSASASSGAGGSEQVAEVFAHSADTLYRVDLATNVIETIGDFSGCSGIIDIAPDKDSQMYGTTYGFLYRIDRTTAACTEIAEGDFPNSLSFVPAGTLDPDEEQLVGYVDADYVRIDTVTGQVDTIASGALTGGRVSSGDIVSVISGPTLLTVKGGGCDDADCVVAVDPVTGQILNDLGTASFNNVFGIAFWDGSLYGFSSYGDAFELQPDGSGGLTPIVIPVSETVSFYGAGSTTSAPRGAPN